MLFSTTALVKTAQWLVSISMYWPPTSDFQLHKSAEDMQFALCQLTVRSRYCFSGIWRCVCLCKNYITDQKFT